MSELPPNPPSTSATTTTIAQSSDDHATEGAPAEREKILSGLVPAGGLGQTITLAVPRLVHDFRLAANLERKIGLGQSCWGERNWIGICGGVWSATWGKGRIVVRIFLFFLVYNFFTSFSLFVCLLVCLFVGWFVCLSFFVSFRLILLFTLYSPVMNGAEQQSNPRKESD